MKGACRALALLLVTGFLFAGICRASERTGTVTFTIDVDAPAEAKTVKLWFPYPTPGLEVLYISGYPAGSDSLRNIFEGGEHLLHKPFTIAELLDKVHQVMDAAV